MKRDAHLTRMELDGTVQERGGQQFLNGKGMASDGFSQVHTLQPHGFASFPVKGGIAAVMSAGGARDSAYAMGGENPSLRPQLAGSGWSAIYNANGDMISIVETELRVVHAATVVIVSPNIALQGEVAIEGNLTCTGNGDFGGIVTDVDGDGSA